MVWMWEDVERFHKKFDLPPYGSIASMPDDLRNFREIFLREEALEIKEAKSRQDHAEVLDGLIDLAYVAIGTLYLGGSKKTCLLSSFLELHTSDFQVMARPEFKLTDGSVQYLVDVTSSCRKAALAFGYNFDVGWARVQSANMKKVRATDSSGKRKSQWDVIKPQGWTAPDLSDLV